MGMTVCCELKRMIKSKEEDRGTDKDPYMWWYHQHSRSI
jgi:hypothetical protein